MSSEFSHHWILDDTVAFFNHGSVGACPRRVLEAQQDWRDRMERNPVRFFARELEPALDAAKEALARFLHCRADELAFVCNATTGVNTILRSLPFVAGDELLTTNHAYNACQNALRERAEQCGCKVVVVHLPLPVIAVDQYMERICAAVSPRTRLLLIDHVTSPTALIMPLENIIREMAQRRVMTLVDGAHAPGMLPLNLDNLGADFYTGNCHKWLCAPKGSAFIHISAEHRAMMRPLVISHGANSRRKDRTRFRLEFDWTGTRDPSPFLSIPTAIDFLQNALPGGCDALYHHNRSLALKARRIIAHALALELPCPDAMIGSMASLVLPAGVLERLFPEGFNDAASSLLALRETIEVPVFPWSESAECLLRVSAQLYNHVEQYHHLARVLAKYV